MREDRCWCQCVRERCFAPGEVAKMLGEVRKKGGERAQKVSDGRRRHRCDDRAQLVCIPKILSVSLPQYPSTGTSRNASESSVSPTCNTVPASTRATAVSGESTTTTSPSGKAFRASAPCPVRVNCSEENMTSAISDIRPKNSSPSKILCASCTTSTWSKCRPAWESSSSEETDSFAPK